MDALTALLASFLLLAIAGWILGRWPARRVASAFAVTVIVLAVATPLYALWKFPSSDAVSAKNNQGAAGWQPYSRATLEQYRAQGKPVFVDFTAAWCLSCKVNERVALRTDAVQAAFSAAVEQWPRQGMPGNPRAWLISTGYPEGAEAPRRERARLRQADGERADDEEQRA